MNKKILTIFLITFAFLTVRNAIVHAWWPDFTLPTNTPTPTTPVIFKFNPDAFKVFTTSTPSPTNTPTPTLTVTPTITTTPPTTEPSEEVKGTATTVTPTSTAATTVSPTTKPEQKKSIPKDYIYAGIGGLLVLIILAQAWPVIKKFLHEKTT